ncbi:unnamed protein product [Ambrosiozyma monospora]|uniref:Unnamed protein product n=1 Tax=Ambrosiozyma monospora TaxID=43982 RepID=A0ACB5T7J6_AMBMO|nr:unnamed protein product [Ambrosiozyma monospora]
MSNNGPSNPVNEAIENTTEILLPTTTNTPAQSFLRSLTLNQTQINSLSGAMAGFVAAVSVCPLDVAKTRSQAQGAFLKDLSPQAVKVYEQYRYKGIFQSLRLIGAEEGSKGLYRGLIAMTLGYFPTWMIYFACYENFKGFYSSLTNNDNLAYCLGAMSAGCISSTATNPIWVVKTRLMLQIGEGKTIYDRFPVTSGSSDAAAVAATGGAKRTYYKGVYDAFRQMARNEGVGSFYNGLLPSYFGLFHVAIQFPLYENLKRWMHITQKSSDSKGKKSSYRTDPNLIKLLVASVASKVIASVITYPHEIIRTRLQIVRSGASVNSLGAISSNRAC